MVMIAGTDCTSAFNPFLISIKVSSKAGTHADTASLELDDRNGQINLPPIGDPVSILLGWEGGGVRQVFDGTVDEVKSKGDRGGMFITVSAKGLDTTSPAKAPQQRHFDNKTVKEVLTDAGKPAGITKVEVDPELGAFKRTHVDMRDESFVNLGERLAREHGGNFKVQGKKATLTKKDGADKVLITATRGVNLHSWDMSPALGRPMFKKAKTRWYDRKKAEWQTEEAETGLSAFAVHTARYAEPQADQAKARTGNDKATSERDAGQGSVAIEGDTSAIPDGLCIIAGARAGVDGSYRIEGVDHDYGRSGGFITTLSLKRAQ